MVEFGVLFLPVVVSNLEATGVVKPEVQGETDSLGVTLELFLSNAVHNLEATGVFTLETPR